MKFHPTTVAFGVLLTVLCASANAEPAGPAFPGNEAVKIVNGKRVAEAPPLTATAQRYVNSGGKFPPPAPAAEVFMIESPEALVECSVPYLAKTACVPSSLGTTKRPRFWTVKLSGTWLHCSSRAAARTCEPASAGIPGGMSSVE
jgi:hypothetical protein